MRMVTTDWAVLALTDVIACSRLRVVLETVVVTAAAVALGCGDAVEPSRSALPAPAMPPAAMARPRTATTTKRGAREGAASVSFIMGAACSATLRGS